MLRALCAFQALLLSISCSGSEYQEHVRDECLDLESLAELKVLYTGPYEVDTIEINETVIVDNNGENLSVPFGLSNDKWNRLLEMKRKNDLIYFFETGRDSWEGLYGRRGYILVRDGCVIDHIFTYIS